MTVLRVEHLGLRRGDFEVRDVSFDIDASEYFILMGPTGAGKSLVLKSIAGLVRVGSGSITIDGEDVTNTPPRARHIGYVPQESGLFPHLSVARNIAFPLEVAGHSRRAARQAIEPIVDSLGVASLLERSTVHLSGGERQKVALARALARRPKLLLLDEPLSALDEATRRDVCQTLLRMRETFSVATLHICHNREEAAALSDRVGVIIDGQLAQAAPLSELREKPVNEEVTRLLSEEHLLDDNEETA